jgi:hypothetical protein
MILKFIIDYLLLLEYNQFSCLFRSFQANKEEGQSERSWDSKKPKSISRLIPSKLACGSNLSAYKFVEIGSGGPIHFRKDEIEAQFFPNPAKDYITIKHNISPLKKPYIKIYDSQGGELVVDKALSYEENQINISHLACGNYVIHINFNGGVFISQLIKE